MEIGIWIDDEQPLPGIVEGVERAARLGFAAAWFGQRTGWDPLTLITAVGSRVAGIRLGTAVALTWPQHPLTLAAQALGTNAAIGGRLTLGVGPSHRVIVEGRYGYRWERPARHVEDYLAVLGPALAGGEVDVRTGTVAAAGAVTVPGAVRPPVLLAAHGPRMLRLAGERADGVLTTWTTARGLAEHVVPAVHAAAVGRPDPQVVVGVVASLTSDPDGTRAFVAERFGMAAELPSYRRGLERDGLAGPADTVIAGDEADLEKAVRRFADAGATELQVCAVGPEADRERTVGFFGALAARVGT
jgi:F420-dependent oxidoreductase-like protein